jgi:hypothetical protein
MAIIQRHLIFLLWAALCVSPLHTAQAQTAPVAAPGTFRLLGLGSVEPMFYRSDARTQQRISLSTSSYSRPYPIPANGIISFYRIGVPASALLPPPMIPVAELHVGQHTAEQPIIIILIPGGHAGIAPTVLADGKPAEFSAVVLDDSFTTHPKNSLRVLSFSKHPTGVKLGSADGAQVRPLESKVIPYPAGDRAMLQIAAFTNNMWAPVSSNLQMLAPNTRLTLFLSDIPPSAANPDPREVTFNKIVEVFHSFPPQASLANR